MTAAVRNGFPEDAPAQVRSALEQIETGAFDMHPATKDRIAAALGDEAEGIFTAQSPCSQLFSDFQKLCRAVTDGYYHSDLGLEYEPQHAITVAAAMEERQKTIRASETIEQLTAGLVRFSHPVRLPEPSARGREEALAELREAKAELGRSTGTLRAEIEKFDQAWGRRFELNSAEALLRANFAIDPDEFAVSRSGSEVVDEAIRSADQQIAWFEQTVGKARSIVERRLAAARDLASIEDPSQAAEWQRLRTALNALADTAPLLLEMQRDITGMSVILQNSAGREEDEDLLTPLNNIGRSAQRKFDGALSKLGDTPYPFDHVRGDTTLAAYLTEGADQSIMEVGALASNRAIEVYFKILDRLAALAMEVESSLDKKDV